MQRQASRARSASTAAATQTSVMSIAYEVPPLVPVPHVPSSSRPGSAGHLTRAPTGEQRLDVGGHGPTMRQLMGLYDASLVRLLVPAMVVPGGGPR